MEEDQSEQIFLSASPNKLVESNRNYDYNSSEYQQQTQQQLQHSSQNNSENLQKLYKIDDSSRETGSQYGTPPKQFRIQTSNLDQIQQQYSNRKIPSKDSQQYQRSGFSTPTKSSTKDHFQQSINAVGSILSSPQRKQVYGDRFIPCRSPNSRLNFSMFEREQVQKQDQNNDTEKEDGCPAYKMMLRVELLGQDAPLTISNDKATQMEQLKSPSGSLGGVGGGKLLKFRSGDKASPPAGPQVVSPFQKSLVGREPPLGSPFCSPRKSPRKIAKGPYKVLDAPALEDDFYLNLVDWSGQNILAVGLGTCVYLWNASTCKVTKLCDLSVSNDKVCSVGWSVRGQYLSVGTQTGEVQIYDVVKMQKLKSYAGHRARVGALSWNSNVLSTGSRDRTILQRDVRLADSVVMKHAAHRSEVCGLKWSYDDRQLASGGNDNILYVWSLHREEPFQKLNEHSAAVKAIAWSPHQHGLLASGGGTADRCIRFWNTTQSSEKSLYTIDTGSQVCNLAWSKNVNELVSTHGYSQNQIIIWKYPQMNKLATLMGHTTRVLYLAVSLDGQNIVTGAGDETLRFWSVFPPPKQNSNQIDNQRQSHLFKYHLR